MPVILLCAATPFEIAPVLPLAQRLPGLKVLITGVGLTAATYALTKALSGERPALVMQAGIAGALDPALPLGATVAVGSETLGDLGVTEGGRFRSLFDLGLLAPDARPWQDQWLVNPGPWPAESGLPVVRSVTVQEITTLPGRIDRYRRELGAGIEAMEGAALHYVCLMEGLPFLQLRTVSNLVGERDKTKWQLEAAITNLNTELERLITQWQHLCE